MASVVLPDNEAERLRALNALHILDTPSEERFDRITRLVAAHFDEPCAAINMIAEDRQWSKSCVGCQQREIAREQSICAYVITSDEMLIVEDASLDPRFSSLPAVTGPLHLRFYAATPIHSPDGHLVGTLCIYGPEPHRFGQDARQRLCDFGNLVERELSASEIETALLLAERNEARFRTAAEANFDSFVILDSVRDEQGKIIDFVFNYANSRVEQIVALPRTEIIGQRLCELLPVNRQAGFFDRYVQVIDSGQAIEEEFPIDAPGFVPGWIHHQVVPLGDGVAITSRDVTARRIAEEESEHTQHQLQEAVLNLERRTRDFMLLNELGELLLSCRTIDDVGNVMALSLRSLLPLTMGALYLEESSGSPLSVVATWGGHPAHDSLALDSCWALRRQRVHYVSADKQELFCRHTIVEHRSESLCIPLRTQGRILGLLHILSLQIGDEPTSLDEAQRQLGMTVAEWTSLALANLMLQRELRQQALRDPLTGLYNRRYFEQLAPEILADAAQDNHPISVVVIDVDHFKQVNDRYGHAMGDQVLQATAKLLQGYAGSSTMACRVGGEEFLLVLPHTDSMAALEIAERLRSRAAEMHTNSVPSIPAISISLGVASFPLHGAAIISLVAAADAALYRAKSGGRNRVVLADPHHQPQDD
ncbi:MAG: diguanylate cyclase [Oscillochloris sp.]|nr:diguanylate cyclase [Oscillochloris sp.]